MRFGRNGAPTLAALVALLWASRVSAQTDTELAPAFRLTPRFWASFVNPVNGFGERKEQYYLPFWGATVVASPGASRKLSLMATALYGTGSGAYLLPNYAEGETTVDRLDVEFLLSRSVAGGYASVYAGPRYIYVDETNVALDFVAEAQSRVWIAQVGVGTVTNLTPDGRNRMFSNLTLGVAFVDWTYVDTDGFDEAGTSVEPSLDVNFGYVVSPSSSLGISARYRGFFISDVNDFDQSRLVTVHGPELALSLIF